MSETTKTLPGRRRGWRWVILGLGVALVAVLLVILRVLNAQAAPDVCAQLMLFDPDYETSNMITMHYGVLFTRCEFDGGQTLEKVWWL